MLEERFELSGTKERNLAMELVRVTEAAALRAGRWMGKGEKEIADQAAVDAMRQALDGVDMDGIVVIGEGEKDEAPMLYIGEQVGNGQPPEVDFAVDPVEGTRLLSLGLPGALAVVATAERGSMYGAPPGVFYMEKIAVGPAARNVVDINSPIAINLERVARARDAQIEDLSVVILDRQRFKQRWRTIEGSMCWWASEVQPKQCWQRRPSSASEERSSAKSGRAMIRNASSSKLMASTSNRFSTPRTW